MAIATPKKGVGHVRKERITLRKRGQVTLSKDILDHINIHEGESIEARLEEDGTVRLVPMVQVPADQAWFWTEKWQREEEEAEKDIKEGNVKSFSNMKDAIAWLDED
ncbi:AbrB/MazE/SpoVT family DNA-binding domain-containing protein [Priestia sp. JV24]|uniref:AbrB/MazE/SpoVT family DNA-binding domain-containing protein n=1 Tax=Priestia TaxID=2800373 RepID=UPI0021D678F6|nr:MULTISPECIES: AbrB/MazE/SpoVT family DNA-binding domain-containing protein [Priestia]MCU7713072.1 AbrB/MazE/SpoVT family DNA-binding domain-containing protein [Priestia megaterium]MCW1049197.1 AbrB/MazE/SpoVT family DNA-binding domain-containing protein [Priestia sp. JV24]